MRDPSETIAEIEVLRHLDGGKFYEKHDLPSSFWELYNRAVDIGEWVLLKAQRGGKLFATFSLFEAAREPDKDKNPLAVATAAKVALDEWAATSDVERAFILNGWRDFLNPPTRQELRAEFDDVKQALRVNVGDRGATLMHDHTMFDGSVAPIRIAIKAGTPKAAALAYLRSALSMVAENWENAVGMHEGQWIESQTAGVQSIGGGK